MNCPICDNKKIKILFTQKDKRTTKSGLFTMFRCDNCQTEYIKPPKNLLDYYKSEYYSNFQENIGLTSKIKQKIFLEKYHPSNFINKYIFNFLGKYISALPPKIGKILDFGCGNGEILYMLKKSGFSVYGMDISKISLKKCRQHGLNNIRIGTEKDLVVYPNNYFDYIRASHVIEHMINPNLFVATALKKLRKKGKLIIQTPNINSLGVLFKTHTKYYFDVPRHTILFSSSSINYLLNKNGFNEINVSYVNFYGDQADNLFIYLKDTNIKLYDIFYKTHLNFVIWLLFIPLEILLTYIGYSQTMTITATKN